MNKPYFVEDCAIITPKDALKGAGASIRREKQPDVVFQLDPNNPDVLSVSTSGAKPQNITLEYLNLTFGEMTYFLCTCGYVAAKLYLPPNGTEFKCRNCYKLKYRSSSINKKSVAGMAIRNFERVAKLVETRANMSRIFYGGNFTKRFERFLGLCDKAGMSSIVMDAQNLQEIVKTNGF